MKFIITNIVSDKSPAGYTTYYAVAEDETAVNIRMANSVKATRKYVTERLVGEYNIMKKGTQQIKIGDILEG